MISINQLRLNKLAIFWILSLLSIPLFSIFGRSLQYFLQDNLSRLQLNILFSAILILLCGLLVTKVMKKNKPFLYVHIAWFLLVFIVVPLFISIPEEKSHFIIFGIFGFLTMLLYPTVAALAICISISALDEGLQWLLPSRVGDLRDIGMNAFASLSASLFVLFALKEK